MQSGSKWKIFIPIFLLTVFISIKVLPLETIHVIPQLKRNLLQSIYNSENMEKELLRPVLANQSQKSHLHVNGSESNLTLVGNAEVNCSKPQFSKTLLPITALPSFPGSGNTWLRHLIQEATGILTGSIYYDPDLRNNGFPGEHTKNGRVIVIKTHHPPDIKLVAQRAVLLIRNPFHALIAEYNRISRQGHTSSAPASAFKDEKWNHFTATEPRKWYNTNFLWSNFKGELFIVRYEDLKSDLLNTMQKLIKFLGLKVSNERLDCLLKNQEGNFHRKKHSYSSVRFPTKSVEAIKKYAAEINQILKAKFNLTVSADFP